MASAACPRVRDLPELRDMILLQLPLRDLLTATRVCRDWADPNAQMQEALFLRRRPAHRVEIVSSESTGDTCVHNKADHDRWMLVPSNENPHIRPCNPLASPFITWSGHDTTDCDLTDLSDIGSRMFLATPDFPVASTDASWNRMQFFQSPATKVKFVCLGGYVERNDADLADVELDLEYEGVEIVKPLGVTCGEMLNALRNHFAGCELCLSWLEVMQNETGWPLHDTKRIRSLGKYATGHEILYAIRNCTVQEEKVS